MKYEIESVTGVVPFQLGSTPHGLPVHWTRIAGVLVVISLLLRHGFPIVAESRVWFLLLDVSLSAAFVADLLLPLLDHEERPRALRFRKFEYFALLLFGFLFGLTLVLSPASLQRLVSFFHLQGAAALRFHLLESYLLLGLSLQLLRGTERLIGRGVRPEWILAGSFAAIILVSTLLLLLPNSSANPENPITLREAFFTATSAACVTGLSVRDTGADFSPFGHMVLLATFQLGGLGIISFVAFLSVFSSRTLPVSQMVAFRQIVNAPALSDLKRQIAGIFVITFLIELAGAIIIFQCVPSDSDPLGHLKWSLFHSVSAFCNAGFALQSDNLEAYRANPGFMLTIMFLILFGGLGFLVISELSTFRFTRSRFFRAFGFFRRLHFGVTPAKLSVLTKLSLATTAILLVVSFLAFWFLEYNNVLISRSWDEKLLVTAFHAVTPRTAGFHSVPIAELRDATLVFLTIIMMIGANPVSTGGGIKTVSFAILILALRALILRRERVEAFGRTIPMRTLLAALSVFFIYVATAILAIFLVALFDPQVPLQDLGFEVISALSTVGFSTGVSATLSFPSQLVLCLAMFVGRVGPISLVLSVFQTPRRLNYAYPEEDVVVG